MLGLFQDFPAFIHENELVSGQLQSRVIEGVRYHMRPLGYIREWELTRNFFNDFPQYKIPQMYRLHKRYNAVKDLAEFRDYKKKHLAAELRDALTVIEVQ